MSDIARWLPVLVACLIGVAAYVGLARKCNSAMGALKKVTFGKVSPRCGKGVVSKAILGTSAALVASCVLSLARQLTDAVAL